MTTTAIKERPIMFSGPMVRAVLEGRKTQTRRVAKLTAGGYVRLGGRNWHPGDPEAVAACPFGQRGDRLWVRETWRVRGGKEYEYQQHQPSVVYDADNDGTDLGPWNPSIFMRRWASRLTLEIVGVRIERLQEISEEDAKAEGARHFPDLPRRHPYGQDPRWSMENPPSTDHCLVSARFAFGAFINKLHGGKNWNLKPSNLWDENPLVWVVEFRRIHES